MEKSHKKSLVFAEGKKQKNTKNDLRKILKLGLVGTIGLVGLNLVEKNQSVNDATQAVTIGMPNFHGVSESEFKANSPVIQKALKTGRMVEIYVDNIPMDGIIQPNSYSNIAEIITPKHGDINVVMDSLALNQGTNTGTNASVVVPGQGFIVNATPGAEMLAKAEAEQGIYK